MKIFFPLIMFTFTYLTGIAQQIDETKPYADKNYAAAIKAATDSINIFMPKKSIPGLSICVSVRGKTVWSQSFGYSDLEGNVKVTPETKFRIGSVSKTITAIGIARLMDRGLISTDSPITRYVPYWPQKRYTITVGEIGSHVAGIRHYNGYEFLSAKHYNNVEESIGIFSGDSLRFAPGTQYQYSSYGYNLLSAAIEGASGATYLDFVRNEIFNPLGMRNTVPDFNDSIIPNRTRFYQVIKNKFLGNGPYVDNSDKWGSGGFFKYAC